MTFQTQNTCWIIKQPVRWFPLRVHKPVYHCLEFLWCVICMLLISLSLSLSFYSSKGKEAKAGGRSGKTTLWLSAKQSTKSELWHNAPIVTRAVRNLWHCQVWKVCEWTWTDRKTADVDLYHIRHRIKKIYFIQPHLNKVVIYLCFGFDIWPLFSLYWLFRSVSSVMDISGLATIPETPTRPLTMAPPSQHVLKRPPLEGDYVTVTDSSGNRVYLRQKATTKVKHPLRDLLWLWTLRVSRIYIHFTIWLVYLVSVSMFFLFHCCLSPGGRF